jgi:hypothetical protein
MRFPLLWFLEIWHKKTPLGDRACGSMKQLPGSKNLATSMSLKNAYRASMSVGRR